MSKAVDLYKQDFRPYNCAQAVAVGAGRADLVETLRTCGGGLAPDGTCGALYAVLRMTPPCLHEKIRREFVNVTGAETCRELNQIGTPCLQCIERAAELVQKYTGRG